MCSWSTKMLGLVPRGLWIWHEGSVCDTNSHYSEWYFQSVTWEFIPGRFNRWAGVMMEYHFVRISICSFHWWIMQLIQSWIILVVLKHAFIPGNEWELMLHVSVWYNCGNNQFRWSCTLPKSSIIRFRVTTAFLYSTKLPANLQLFPIIWSRSAETTWQWQDLAGLFYLPAHISVEILHKMIVQSVVEVALLDEEPSLMLIVSRRFLCKYASMFHRNPFNFTICNSFFHSWLNSIVDRVLTVKAPTRSLLIAIWSLVLNHCLTRWGYSLFSKCTPSQVHFCDAPSAWLYMTAARTHSQT